MTISTAEEFEALKNAGYVVGETLKQMVAYTKAGISTKEIDDFGKYLLLQFGAQAAPSLLYQFPGATCISVNNEVAHGVPTAKKIIQEGDLVNIDVSAKVNGYFADNGCSFVVGSNAYKQSLCDASLKVLSVAINHIKHGVKISEVGYLMEQTANNLGYNVIYDLTGHGVGKKLHEHPQHIPCYYDKTIKTKFEKGMVVAIETFISTKARHIKTKPDKWTLYTADNSLVAQYEHTIMVTDGKPVVFTQANGIVIE